MASFFTSIYSETSVRPLLAAWGIEGEAAGTKALFAWEKMHYSEISRDESFRADWSAKIRELSRGQSGILTVGKGTFFLEPILKGRKLVICGAGHVALSVIRLAKMVEFEVTVIEDREIFARKAEDAGADHVICRSFDDGLACIDGDAMTAFVIMTREHAHDVDCLRRILKKPFAYTGMMGSHSRTALIREQMLKEGFDAEKVNALHMPIGLSIGSRTPEEIAVSVVAELIQVMNAAGSGEGFPADMLTELTSREEKAVAAPAILAIVVEKQGEAPRKPGTKMLVREDGACVGTIGGGYAEAQVTKIAREMIREQCRTCRNIRINMEKGAMYCGGEITVSLLPV